MSKVTLREQFLSLRLLSASGGWIRNPYSRKIPDRREWHRT